MKPIEPLTEDNVHEIACEVDHDLREGREDRSRFSVHIVARLLATIGALKANRPTPTESEPAVDLAEWTNAGDGMPQPGEPVQMARDDDGTNVSWRPLAQPLERLGEASTARLDLIRAAGWMVAIHNDYTLNGKRFTYWSFTKGDRYVKGEGESDAAALREVQSKIAFIA